MATDPLYFCNRVIGFLGLFYFLFSDACMVRTPFTLDFDLHRLAPLYLARYSPLAV